MPSADLSAGFMQLGATKIPHARAGQSDCGGVER